MLRLENVSYIYNQGLKTAVPALDSVSLDISEGEFLVISGRTGSGKSTLIKLFNGLLKPASGSVFFKGEDIWVQTYNRRLLKGRAGLVLQYPEDQLFAQTVLEDVMYGPRNLGLSKEDARKTAVSALEAVGLGPEVFDRDPFTLSGGQKRMAAVAGVLAMKPELLILDEPCEGLDPAGRNQMLALMRRLNQEEKVTVVLVTHSMEDAAMLADRIAVLDAGVLVKCGPPAEIFSNREELAALGLALPVCAELMHRLRANGADVRTGICTLEEAEKEILRVLGK